MIAVDAAIVVSWLSAALRPSGPYPLLAISGEQGSAKTALSKMLRALVDPNIAPLRALPREERELFIAANNGHVLAFDNISRLRSWLSMRFAGWRAAAVSPRASSTQTRTKCYSMPPGRSFSMASRKSSPGPTSRTDRFS